MGKGHVADVVVLLVFIAGIGFGTLILFNIFNLVNDELMTALDSSDAQASVTASRDIWTAMGWGFIIFVAFNFIGLVLTSWMIDTHPAFFIIFVTIGVFMLLIAPIISNAYESIATSSQFSATASSGEMEGMHTIMLNLPLIALAQLVVSGVVLFAKRYSSRGAL